MAYIPSRALLDLTGKTALVTGAGRGIGMAVARRLADAGARVVVNELREELCEDTVRLIAAEGGQVKTAVGDLAHPTEIGRIVEQAAGAFGGIDVLVNNAALRGFSPWDELSEEDWDRYMAVNLKAVFFTTQATAKHMVKKGEGGCIINIASVAAERPVPAKVDYNAAKAAVAALTRSFAVELGPHNIRVNAVGPGATDTQGGSAGQSSEEAQRFAENWTARLALPVGYADPDDMARAVLFLASPASRYITAQVLYVDAGYLAG